MALVRGCSHKLKERVRIEIELKNYLTRKRVNHHLRTTELLFTLRNLTPEAYKKKITTNMYTFFLRTH